MDITGIDLAAFGTAIGSVITAVKGFLNAKNANDETLAIKKEREVTKMERDREFQSMRERIVVLENENKHLQKSLNDGNDRFDKIELKIDDLTKQQAATNSLLQNLIGMVGEIKKQKGRGDERQGA